MIRCIEPRKLRVVLAGMLTISISGWCVAETSFFSDHEQFGAIPQYNDELMILPTGMMDDETLFLAAKIQRENKMPASQRLINNYWLLANHNNTHGSSGGAILGRLVRESLISYWRGDTDETGLKGGEHSDIFLSSHYKVRVSRDRIVLTYEYRF